MTFGQCLMALKSANPILDRLSFGRIYVDSINRRQTEYVLPKDLTLTRVTGYDVRRDIESMLSALEIDVSSFAHIYRDAQNRRQEEYLLPKDLTLTLVTGYDVKRRQCSMVSVN